MSRLLQGTRSLLGPCAGSPTPSPAKAMAGRWQVRAAGLRARVTWIQRSLRFSTRGQMTSLQSAWRASEAMSSRNFSLEPCESITLQDRETGAWPWPLTVAEAGTTGGVWSPPVLSSVWPTGIRGTDTVPALDKLQAPGVHPEDVLRSCSRHDMTAIHRLWGPEAGHLNWLRQS